jgi:hypothetical protein
MQDRWLLAYASDFSSEAAEDEWEIIGGKAIFSEAQMILLAEQGDAQVMLKAPCFLSPSVRVEASAYVAEGFELGGMSLFINANKAASKGSYSFQLGAEDNTLTRLERIGQIVENTSTDAALLEHKHLYKIISENDDGHIRFVADGKTIIEWEDEHPLWGPEHCRVGFHTRNSAIVIEYIKIYHKVPKS